MAEKLFNPKSAATGDHSDSNKRALILPGGGLRLSYAAGVIAELFERKIGFDHMDGTSGGSLNLAMLLSGLTIDDICERWKTLNLFDTISLPSLHELFTHKSFVAASDSDAFRQKVFPHLGIDFAKIRAAEGFTATFNVCNFANKMNEVIEHTAMTEDFLIAGMSLPGALPPVVINGVTYLDSGFIQDANLIDTVKRGANELWLIWIMGNTPNYRSGLLDCYVQMLEMSANGALIKDILHLNEINTRIAKGEVVYGHHQPIVLHLIKPSHPLPLDSALYLGEITHAQLIEMGRCDARSYFKNFNQEGVPLEPDILKMTTQNPGITFKETMAGGFSLSATDPKEGRDRGKQAGTELAMHAEVKIDDLDRFIADPNHLGGLTGTIDYKPLGTDIVANSGVFNLFNPTDDPTLKLMVYELAFEHNGEAYYLAGRKEVREGHTLDLWPETTTLYTQLHKGADKTGPVVGAGILTLDVVDLIRLVSTMRVINADDAADKVVTIGKFGKFFLGELWDSYAKHVI